MNAATPARPSLWKRLLQVLTRWTRERPDIMAAVGPYWGLADSLERVRDQSHWCGAGRWSRDRRFAYGDRCAALIWRYLGDHVTAETVSGWTALDWGCGGGAVCRVLCDRFHRVWGVEISEATLMECRKRMGELHKDNFLGLLVRAEEPERAITVIGPGTVDFALSVGVFKHFPSRDYTLRVLKVLAELTRPGGFLFLQYRYDDGTPKYRPKDCD
ncbi:MAG: class I SAM-dependent methyltransferase, partial [Syntrophales bacterium]|nr:class I SAM-dependent methyltransferase [Syntrophales bacterium]